MLEVSNLGGPQRWVDIPRFAIGKYEVTKREFGSFVIATGYRTEAEKGIESMGCLIWIGNRWDRRPESNWRDPGFPQQENHPVVCVSWNDAQAYLRWLNEREPKGSYRLLSEAEWEYAARAGSTSVYPWGDKVGYGNANCNGCGSSWDGKTTAPVGSFHANAFFVHDMHGNVLEWVHDAWHDDYAGAPKDGSVRMTAGGGVQADRVLRGGSWRFEPRFLRSAFRGFSSSHHTVSFIGFRIARTY